MTIEELSTFLIDQGVSEQFQDLYLLPREKHYEYFFRKGDDYFYQACLTTAVANQLISRFKYLGQMDVSEKRRSQMGALSYDLTADQQRLRLSTVGDYRQQESLVARFIHPYEKNQAIHYFLPEQVAFLEQQITKKGLYLFCGAVGSGKTTLMYRLAKQATGQVITIEDPVEIEEPSFLQLQVNPKINQTYHELIKLSLRHHPDILIIGEIRDEKTAQSAIRAALTGHRVFATLHAASLETALARMCELGGERSLVNDCLQGMVYQEMLTFYDQSGVLLAYEFETEKVDWKTSQCLLKEQKRRGKVKSQAKDPAN